MNDVMVTEPESRVPRLGERAVRRPEPAFAHVLGAAAGAFAVVAIVAFVVEVASSDPTAPGVGFDAALAIVALVVGFRAPGPLRSAAVTILVLTVPLIWLFALFGGGNAGRGEIRGLYALTLLSYLGLYLLGWTRGRAVLLAGVLVVAASWISFEVASNDSSVVPFQSQSSSSPFSIPGTTSGSGSTTFNGNGTSVTINNGSSSDSNSIAALAIGIVFLVVGGVLDHRRLSGAATAFIAVGAFEAIVGAITLGASDGTLTGGLIAAATGAIVGIIGARGRGRRGSTWIGVLTVFGGLVAVLVDIAPSSAAAVGGIALGFAVALGAIAVWLAPRLGEPDDGGMQPGAGYTSNQPAVAVAAPATAGAGAVPDAPPATTDETGPDEEPGPPPV
jgi:hypothetical protein